MTNYCLVVAGEKSGEEHFLSFIKSLKHNVKEDLKFFGVGGDELRRQEMELIYHLKDFSSIGFSLDVIKRIPFYYKAMDRLVELCIERKVKVAILIDFQGFNLKIAERLHKRGIKVMYYVAPQAWIWKEGRVSKLRKFVDALFCIVPFEKKWFQLRGVKQAISVAHPVWEKNKEDVKNISRVSKKESDLIKILLLPGSRNFEVNFLLGEFSKAVSQIKETTQVEVSIVKTNSVNPKYYSYYNEIFDKVYDSNDLNQAMLEADFCFAASGTVTLQCGVFQLPTVVTYKVSLLNEFVIRNLMKYSGYASLTNLILEEEVFPEIMQDQVTADRLKEKFFTWLKDPSKQDYIQKRLKSLEFKLGHADCEVGAFIANYINEDSK